MAINATDDRRPMVSLTERHPADGGVVQPFHDPAKSGPIFLIDDLGDRATCADPNQAYSTPTHRPGLTAERCRRGRRCRRDSTSRRSCSLQHRPARPQAA